MNKHLLPLVVIFLVTAASAQCPTDEADFANGGTFSGPCSVDYGGNVTITGAVIWTSGTMTMNDMDNTPGFVIASGGSLTIQSGTFTLDDVDGGGNNDARMTVDAGGSLTIQNGATLNVEDNIDIDGTVTVEAGGNLTITLAGEIEVTGTLDVYGTVTTAGGGQDGNIEANGGYISVYGPSGYLDVSDDLKAYNGGTIYVSQTGVIDVGDNMVNAETGTGGNPSTGTFIIDGTVNVTNNVTIYDTTPNSSLSGAGTINITNGTLVDNEGDNNFSCSGTPEVCTGTNNPLPVELLSFDYENSSTGIILSWTTASEKNNEGFEVERSSDGQAFNTIAFVSGFGTTNELHNYSFTDLIPINQGVYYRLRQVDFDGQFEYSRIIFVSSENKVSRNLELYPNPTKGSIILLSQITNYVLYDLKGNLLLKNTNTTSFIAQNEISQKLTVSEVGIYLLVTRSEGQSNFVRIVKK